MSLHAIGSTDLHPQLPGQLLVQLQPAHAVHLAWRADPWRTWPFGLWLYLTGTDNGYREITVELTELLGTAATPELAGCLLTVGTWAYSQDTTAQPWASAYLSHAENPNRYHLVDVQLRTLGHHHEQEKQ